MEDLPLAVVGRRAWFMYYCYEHDISPNSRDIVHVYDVRGARGYRFRGVERLGSFPEHDEAYEVALSNVLPAERNT
jgi:hypothetical protein